MKMFKIDAVKNNSLVIIFFIFLSLVATFPLVLNFSGQIYGDAKDALGAVWNFWWINYAKINKISPTTISSLVFPFGTDLSSGIDYPVWNLLNLYLTYILGEIAAYNLQILFGFIFSGLAMYYLVFFFTKDVYASVLSGLIFTFSPYHFAHAFEHLGLSNMQWVVLYILCLFNFQRQTTYKNAVICGFAFSIVGFFDYYYLYFMLIFTALFLVYCFFYFRADLKVFGSGKIKAVFLAVVNAVLCLLPFIYNIVKLSFFVQSAEKPQAFTYTRPFGHLFADSARLLDYFLPAHFHPFLGRITKPFIGSFLYGDNPPEQTLYLGFVGLILAFLGWWKRGKGRYLVGLSDLKKEENFIITFFSFSFIAFMICSFPPYLEIGKIFLPFPSFFLYKIFPMFRNYARMGMLVLISMCVLTGFGLRYVFDKIDSSRKRGILVCLLGVVVFFEFLPYPPVRVIDVSNTPALYKWLKNQPADTVIAEYPLDADIRAYILYQRVHEKKLINGALPGTYAYEVFQKIIDIENPNTAGILSFLGAKYIIIHKDRYQAYEGGNVLGRAPDLSAQASFRLVKSFGPADVYEINAEKIDPKTVKVKEAQKDILENSRYQKEKNNECESLNNSVYQVNYFWFIPAFDVNICKRENIADISTAVLIAQVKSTDFFSNFFKMKGKYVSVFDVKNLYPLEYSEEVLIKENKKREKHVVFDHKNLFMQAKDKMVNIFPGTQDPVSMFFFIPEQQFEKHKKIITYVNPGKSNYKMQMEVIGKEKITLNGFQKSCWKIEGEFFKVKETDMKIGSLVFWIDEESRNRKIHRLQIYSKIGVLNLILK
ncbi:MAG: DUF3108 domain-containing protein [Candidatus Omnitrophica bacterium]|nr:DUF3108 domain-containing protein [Candidatus Omnitrophota bacterium]